uniref:Uncharacterized protein n=1 Tax=Macaca fascicularis TaxID=9541 RepID=A0A7N9CE28_MACFA
MISAHCNLHLLGSSDSLSSASRGAGITGVYRHAQVIFAFLVESGFCHIGQAGVELLTSSDPPALASQSVGLQGASYCNWHRLHSFFFFLRQSLTLSPRLECSGMTSTHCNLCLAASGDSHVLASQVTGATGAHHQAQLILVVLVEMGFHYVGQGGLELLTSSDSPALASQSVGITGMSHCTRPQTTFLTPSF